MDPLLDSSVHRGDSDRETLYLLFCFLIVMKGLNSMIKTAKVRGWLRGFEEEMEIIVYK